MKLSSANTQRGRSYLLTGTFVVMWLLLNQTLALSQIVLAFVLAVGLTRATRDLRPIRPRIRRVYLAAGLLPVLLGDIVRSNIAVARIVLGLGRSSAVRSGFVKIPLTIRDPFGVAVIAVIVTSTPGTVWVDLSIDGSVLTLHVLDLRDEAEWVDWIKNRYEKPLMEIFE